MRDVLTLFLDGIKAYEHESGHSMHEDERDSSEIIDIFLNESCTFSFTEEQFRRLFNELVKAGRSMQEKDSWGRTYMSEDMYFKDVKAKYSNKS